jgi:hypothetical protein
MECPCRPEGTKSIIGVISSHLCIMFYFVSCVKLLYFMVNDAQLTLHVMGIRPTNVPHPAYNPTQHYMFSSFTHQHVLGCTHSMLQQSCVLIKSQKKTNCQSLGTHDGCSFVTYSFTRNCPSSVKFSWQFFPRVRKYRLCAIPKRQFYA